MMIPRSMMLTVLLLTLMVAGCAAEREEGSQMPMFQNKVRAPEFPDGLDWLNTSRPLEIKELRGKIVILDFWTYCCINCHHVIPDLKKLEEKYAEELVVIGVHSAKFSTERDSENIRQAVLRHEIEHPVVNDAQMEIWSSYGVRAWPTLMLIDPEGYVVGYRSGEGIFEPFDQAISALISTHEESGSLDRAKTIDVIQPMLANEPGRLLSFPHKVLFDETRDQLFIADTNNNRIVIVDYSTSEIVDFAGSGAAGRADGGYEEAMFDKPTGLFLEGNYLYVADTENHLIRKVNLNSRRVMTIAGTGSQARQFNQSGDSLQVALNSPWDVLIRDGVLFIANAGSHQIYKMNLETGELQPHAGSGRENRIDGNLTDAQLAQPSGLAADEEHIYFADSEVSAIRAADIVPGGRVDTVAGGELFEFGAVDAAGLDARFQHPLGVAYKDGKVYVADTYNNSIRVVDVESREVKTLFGNGEAGMTDGGSADASFDEPAGIDVKGDILFIADTNNHMVRIADLKTGEVSTLMLKLPLTLSQEKADQLFRGVEQKKTISLSSGEFQLKIALPEGTKLNPLAESLLLLRDAEGNDSVVLLESLDQRVNWSGGKPAGIGLIIYYCDDQNEGLCYLKSLAFDLLDDAAAAASLEVDVTAAGPAEG